MKILVAVKRVMDPNLKVRVKADGSGIDLAGAKMVMNPFCEIALEEAVRLKERGVADEVVVVSIGGVRCQDTLRIGLALGADRAVHVETAADPEPLAVAKLLRAVAEREAPRLVLLGKQAVDDDANQTGQMLAALLGWPQGTFASKLVPDGERLLVTREVDEGLETLSLSLPAVVTADLRLNEPRYVRLPNLMRAKKQAVTHLTPDELGVDAAPRITVLRVECPPGRPPGVRVASVPELVDRLRGEAGVLP